MAVLLPHEVISSAKEKFFKSLQMRDWLNYLSIKTWYDLEKGRVIGGVREETLTENILLETCDAMNKAKMPVRLFRALDEKTNGGDLEIFVQHKNKYVRLALQAKKVFVDKKYIYDSADHIIKGSGQLQINLLLDYASKMKAVPLFLFYNYCDNETINERILYQEKIKPPITHFGCSFTDAHWVKQQFVSGSPEKWSKKPGIIDVHPPSRPFSELDLFRTGYSWGELMKKLNISTAADDIDLIDPAALDITSDWREYRPNPVFKKNDETINEFAVNPTGASDFITKGQQKESTEIKGFFPKFRMVLERGVVSLWDKKSLHLK